MDIDKDFIEENALKITDKTGGGDTTESDSPENFKSKKRSESSLGQVDPKNVRITIPSSKIDEKVCQACQNILTKHTVYLEKKIKNNTWTFSQSS